jgi:uncharacterized small protein (DUF1192 family)
MDRHADPPVSKRTRLIDLSGGSVNDSAMDMDELFAKRPQDPLTLLVKQDLDPLSVNELKDRVAILEAEIARVNRKIEGSVNFRASAEGLFKR